MFKFLRKYDKWILVVGGSLLLITFLAPQAIQGLAEYSAQTGASWAKVGKTSEKVTLGEADMLRRQARLIDSMGSNAFLNQLGAGGDPAHWYLLLREAKAAGLVGGPGTGFELAARMAAESQEGITAEQVISLLGSRAGLNYDQSMQTLADIQGVSRLIALVSNAGRFSDTRLRGTAARKSLGISADIVVLDARGDSTIDVAEQEEAALLEQLNAHAESLVGEGDRGFGYRIPDRFQIEWFAISRAQVEASLLEDPALGPVELRKAYQRNPEKFGGGAISSSATPASFSSREETIRSTLLEELVEERMRLIAKFADDRLQFPRRSLKRSGLHFVLPEDWASQRASMTELAGEIGKQFGLETPEVDSTSDDWVGAEDLADASRFGPLSDAGTDLFGRTRTTVSELAPNLKEFGGSDTMPIQSGVAFPSLKTPEGDLVIARITDADPSHPPAELALVRDKVAADLEAVVRYETLLERLSDIEALARTEGIRAVANAYETPVEFAADIREANLEFLIQYGLEVSSSLPGVGTDPDAISAIIDRAIQIDPTTPLADQSIESRVFAVPLPERLMVLLVSVEGINPLTLEQWNQLATNPAPLQAALSRDLGTFDPSVVFGLEALTDRHDFEFTRVDLTEDDAGSEADAEVVEPESAS